MSFKMRHATSLIVCLAMVSSGMGLLGCQKRAGDETSVSSERIENDERPTPETAIDDLVGNWRLDLSRSRSAGLKNEANAGVNFSMLVEPDGSRTLYRSGQPIEQGQLVIEQVATDGTLTGRFERTGGRGALSVVIKSINEETLEWRFAEGNRVEVFTRKLVEPNPDFIENQ